MFKYIHKVSSYGDELRVDLNLNKRSRNYRFKNKVLYIRDQTIFCKDKNKNRFYYKYKYVVNDEIMNNPIRLKNNILYRIHNKVAFIGSHGDQFWFYQGKIHRENDLPAILYTHGDRVWCYKGKIHRENDKPAIIYPDGTQEWYKNGIQYTP